MLIVNWKYFTWPQNSKNGLLKFHVDICFGERQNIPKPHPSILSEVDEQEAEISGFSWQLFTSTNFSCRNVHQILKLTSEFVLSKMPKRVRLVFHAILTIQWIHYSYPHPAPYSYSLEISNELFGYAPYILLKLFTNYCHIFSCVYYVFDTLNSVHTLYQDKKFFIFRKKDLKGL